MELKISNVLRWSIQGMIFARWIEAFRSFNWWLRPDANSHAQNKCRTLGGSLRHIKRCCRTVEFTRPRGSGNLELQKHLEKHAIASRVQRFVGLRQPSTRFVGDG